MAIRERMSGNEAVAYGIRQVNPDVMPAFPITPSTEIPQMVSTYIANGEVDTEFIPVESEHSSMSAAIGAEAAGARSLTATSSAGLALMWEELLLAAADLLRHCTVNQFEVWRGGERMTSLPVLILILLVVLAYWISLPLLVIGLLFGCRYRFSGPDLDRNKVGEVANQVSDSVRDAVGQVREQFKKEFSRSRHRKGK